jgi:hypothetical protein
MILVWYGVAFIMARDGIDITMGKNDNKERIRPEGQMGEDEILLEQYAELRTGIRQRISRMRARETKILAAIAAVVGSAFYFETGGVLITLIPVVLAAGFMTHILSSVWILRLAKQIIEIEEKIEINEFSFEQTHGLLSNRIKTEFFPIISLWILFGAIYFVSVSVVLNTISPPESAFLSFGSSPNRIRVDRDQIRGLYALATVLMLVSAGSYIWIYYRLRS